MGESPRGRLRGDRRYGVADAPLGVRPDTAAGSARSVQTVDRPAARSSSPEGLGLSGRLEPLGGGPQRAAHGATGPAGGRCGQRTQQ